MQAVPVDFIVQAKPAIIEVKGQYGASVSVAYPRVSGDTVFGTKPGRNTAVALPLHEIERITARRPSTARTVLLIGGAAAVMGVATYVFLNQGNGETQLNCPYENPVDPYEREVCGV
jgi:hypothetical protein